jgi:hypothetical protein
MLLMTQPTNALFVGPLSDKDVKGEFKMNTCLEKLRKIKLNANHLLFHKEDEIYAAIY